MYDSADMSQIRDLYANYAWLIDEGHYDAWIKECFTEDGVFESPRFGRNAGHDGLQKFVRNYVEWIGGAQVRHLMSNVLATIDGDRASGRCNLAYYHSKHGKSELSALGGYLDKLRKVGDRWLFESRQIFLDGAARPPIGRI
jgi:3-phenylpropionate/cinnamic acid dioxygenase small subunit